MPVNATCPNIALAMRWAALYRSLGYNPLPSCRDRKRPAIRGGYRRYKTEAIPTDWLTKFWTPNIQIVTGCRWNLCVVDCDGAAGLDVWRLMTLHRFGPPTWESTSCGADSEDCRKGLHVWYSIPAGVESLRSRKLWGLWDGTDWARRASIDLLCDGSLIVAPPSIHPTSGRRYRWLPGHSPDDIARPAEVPAWLMALPACERPKSERAPYIPLTRKADIRPVAGRYERAAVLDRIADPASLAASWGLRLASDRPNGAGWYPCHAIGREDRHPSAAISARTGMYWEPGGRAISLFDLAVRLGAYPSWQSACDSLGERFKAKRSA